MSKELYHEGYGARAGGMSGTSGPCGTSQDVTATRDDPTIVPRHHTNVLEAAKSVPEIDAARSNEKHRFL